jgi:hypothetical protein
MNSTGLKQEKQWQAESDARILADAAKIRADKARANRAVKAARQMATDAAKTAKTVSKQAGVRRKK